MLNINYIDLIGKNVVINNCSDTSKIGCCGIVIFQTKNILNIRNKNNKIIKVKVQEILDLKEI
jgi:RNase P/RNase MRP subunit p29